MNDNTGLPHLAAGKISQATQDMMDQAKDRFGVKGGALVRMALEDFMPRYLSQGQGEEFAAKVAKAVDGDEGAKAEVERVLRKIERRRRQTVLMASA